MMLSVLLGPCTCRHRRLVSHTVELAALVERARGMPLLLSARRGLLLLLLLLVLLVLLLVLMMMMLNQTAIRNVFALLYHLGC